MSKVKPKRQPLKLAVRRLAPGDEALLAFLAQEDVDFDLAGRGAPLKPLSKRAAQAYLADPGVLHWIAEARGQVVGHTYCCVVRKRGGDPTEVLLYEIGVRSRYRRHGVGRALVKAMNGWMKAHRVREAWVVADNPIAVAFYRALGFETVAADEAVYMAR